MSVHFSYFSRNNTIVYNSLVNTGRNPVTELFYGPSTTGQKSYSRFIFDLNLSQLREKITDGTISMDCSSSMKHILRMTNTSFFDESLLNDKAPTGKRRATSFDLFLFRITTIESWDEGVGYDYVNYSSNKSSLSNIVTDDKSYSERPSNWVWQNNLYNWPITGIYNESTIGELTIVDRQHFEFGNENIEFDMTDEINSLLDGTLNNVSGWGVAFYPELENLVDLSESYSVGFFTRHTQTFYEPYLETTYDDCISDDRLLFTQHKENKLYLAVYENGDYVNLDVNPYVTIRDSFGDRVSGMTLLETCRITKGIYEVTVPNGFNTSETPCIYYDTWSNLKLNGITIPDVENEFILQPYKKRFNATPENRESNTFIFSHFGILQNEKILNSEIRKIGVAIKKSYSNNYNSELVTAQYRLYVKEGNTEVQVQDWTNINKINTDYYFILDTRDKIPNQYYIDIKVNSYGSVNVYKKTIMFQIVDKI